MTSVVIIGAGHNGLTAAFYLAKAGVKTIVLERSDRIGGGAITREIEPGFLCPTLSHEVLLHERIAREMDLQKHGVELLESPVDTCGLSTDGAPLVLWNEPRKCADSIKRRHARDADTYPRFVQALERAAAVVAETFTSAPPDIDKPSAGDIWNLLKAARAFRALGQRDEFQLLRWLPMPVGDFASEWFEDDLLRAMVAGPGVSGTMLGPRSAGSTLVLLLRGAHRGLSGRRRMRVRGGPGRLTQAMAAAATDAGAEIRTSARVERIVVRNERVAGVVVDGQEMPVTAILSCADPKTTFLELIDPVDLSPDFLSKMRHYRASGTVAKVNLALSALPSFNGVDGPSAIAGRVHVGPNLDYIEQAFDHVKYGECSRAPWLDITFPSILDPALAPAGAHVASVYAHYAPFALRNADWRSTKDELLASVLNVLDAYAPGFKSHVVAADVISPEDLHADYGFAGGHVFHGELALDQLYAMRPLLGFGRYETPIAGLFLGGAGTHPGGFMTGASGRLAVRRVLQSRGLR